MKRELQKEFVRDLVAKATGAKFEIIERSTDPSLPTRNLEWFIRCRNLKDIENTPYLNTVSKEKKGSIWLESLAVGDTFEWIGTSYGDEAATESLDLNYSNFSEGKFHQDFVGKYPLVARRIQECESIAEQASKKYKAHLELRSSGSKGIVVFTFAARIPPEETRSSAGQIEAGVSALKDAYQQASQS